MEIFKYKEFSKWAKIQGLENDALKKAISEMRHGMYEANLGGGLYKKRVPLKNKGKSGGYRTLIAFNDGDKAFFIYGFAKNVKVNIKANEKKIYRMLAKDFLGMNKTQIQTMVNSGKLIEVK